MSAALCTLHARACPPALTSLAISHLVDLALAMPAPHSATAASLLCDTLHAARDSNDWAAHLGAIPVFMQRIYAACMRIHDAAAKLPPLQQVRFTALLGL